MRILLLQLDGKLPNVALMRIAAHHRALGDEVELRRAPTVASVQPGLFDRHDRVYASTIFERTRPMAERVRALYPDARIGDLIAYQRWVIGGYDKSIPWEDWLSARGQPRNLTTSAQRSLPLFGGGS